MEPPLPDLMPATAEDSDLRQVVIDADAFAAAVALSEERLLRARAAGNQEQISRLLGYLGDALRILRRLDESIVALREALTIARQLDHTRLTIANLIRLGEAERYRRDLADAERSLRAAVNLAQSGQERDFEGFALQHLGKCLIDAGRPNDAINVLSAALAIRRAAGRDDLIASTERALALARRQASSAVIPSSDEVS